MRYDVIIVGAGTAGCVLAARLSEDSARSVLLLEAGPDYPDPKKMPPDVKASYRPTFAHDWGYYSEPGLYGRKLHLVRGKLVGGCSSINACLAVRGDAGDFDAWAKAGNPGWSYDEVLPYFRKLEDDIDFINEWHGQDGPLPIRRFSQQKLTPAQSAFLTACDTEGISRVDDLNDPGVVGAGRVPLNQVEGVRQSTAETYLRPARKRQNLIIRGDVIIDRILWEGKHAAGVFLAGSGEKIDARTIIVSAGAYGSPAVLMRSGIGNAEHLTDLGIKIQSDLPGVGQNLIDHPAFAVRLASTLPLPVDALVPTFQTLLTLKSTNTTPGWDIMIKPTSIHPVREPTEYKTMFTIFSSLAKPKSRGTVKIRAADPDVPPVIDPGFFTARNDIDTMLEAVRVARRLSQAPPLKELSVRELAPGAQFTGTPDIERAILSGFDTFHHPVGTCKMGPERDEKAVVDSRGKVRGVEGLYVIDSSIMPEITSGPTCLPVIMLSERCADWLMEG